MPLQWTGVLHVCLPAKRSTPSHRRHTLPPAHPRRQRADHQQARVAVGVAQVDLGHPHRVCGWGRQRAGQAGSSAAHECVPAGRRQADFRPSLPTPPLEPHLCRRARRGRTPGSPRRTASAPAGPQSPAARPGRRPPPPPPPAPPCPTGCSGWQTTAAAGRWEARGRTGVGHAAGLEGWMGSPATWPGAHTVPPRSPPSPPLVCARTLPITSSAAQPSTLPKPRDTQTTVPLAVQ